LIGELAPTLALVVRHSVIAMTPTAWRCSPPTGLPASTSSRPLTLPSLLGELEQAKARAWARLAQPVSPASAPPEDYTAEGLAAHLKLSKGTVYRLYRGGAWPNAHKIGLTKGLRIPRADVEAWRAGKAQRPRFEMISGKRPW